MPRLTWQQSQEQGDLADDQIILPKKRRFVIREEDHLQIQCMVLIRTYIHRHPGKLRYMVIQPERTKPPLRLRDFFKKLGILGNPGIPELLLLPADPELFTLIELKTARGKFSAEQLSWATWCEARGYRHRVVRTCEELSVILDEF
jgi:hypothetical protein